MILETDTDLTSPQYAALLTDTGDPWFNVTLEQYSLAFSSHDSGGHSSVVDAFDAIVCDDTLVRVYRSAADTLSVQTLATEDASDQSWSAAADLTATGISSTIPPVLAVISSTVRIFWTDGARVYYFENSAKGVGNAASWGSVVDIGDEADIGYLAAPTYDNVIILRETTDHNWRWCEKSQSSGWNRHSQGLYYPFVPDSWDAVAGLAGVTDESSASSVDCVAMCADLPPIISHKLEGTELSYELTRVEGVLLFMHQFNHHSQHVTFDVVDGSYVHPARHDVRLSVDDNYIYMTYYREDGTEDNPHTSLAISRARDTVNFELPYILNDHVAAPSIFLHRGNHCYLINSQHTYRSLAQGFVDDAQTTLDLTDYVISLALTQKEVQQADITLANPQQALDSLSPFCDDVSMQLRIKLGYTIDGTNVIVQTFLGDVVAIGGNEQIPRDQEVIVATDHLGRVNSMFTDQVIEWFTQVVGADDYTGTLDYEGMKHTAPQEGTFKTTAGESELKLIQSDSEGVAFSTYIYDDWNVCVSAMVRAYTAEPGGS